MGTSRTAVVGALFVLATSGIAFSAVDYTITDLGTLGGYGSCAYGINNAGQVVGVAGTPSGYGHAFLYSEGMMRDLGTLGGRDSRALGINDAGQVVGWFVTTSGTYRHPFLYTDGSMSDLATPGTNSAEARGINNIGQIAVYASRGYIYYDGNWTDLGTVPGRTGTIPEAINNSGDVTGLVSDFLCQHIMWYADGNLLEIGSLPGNLPGDDYSSGTDINDSGQISGWSFVPGRHVHPVLYSGGTLIDLGTLGGLQGRAFGINNSGQVVGWAYTGSGQVHAFLYRDGNMMDLNDLIDPNSGWILRQAYAINDSRQIVGYGWNAAGAENAFLLTHAPEPSSILLLTLGSLLCYCRTRRQRHNCGQARVLSVPKSLVERSDEEKGRAS